MTEEDTPLASMPTHIVRAHINTTEDSLHPPLPIPSLVTFSSAALSTTVTSHFLLTEGINITSRRHPTCSTPNPHGGYFLQTLPGLLQLPPGETEAVHRGGLQERGQVTRHCRHRGLSTKPLTITACHANPPPLPTLIKGLVTSSPACLTDTPAPAVISWGPEELSRTVF